MWGYSPAFNLLDEDFMPNEEDDPYNVLLLQPGDIRHLLKTISERTNKQSYPIHVYIYEETMEILARHLMLLFIACDWSLPMRFKVNTFLEIFGNTLLQVILRGI